MGFASMLDECIGRVIAELKQEGLYDDAIIVFMSDHGEMLGSHSLFQKMCLYEEAVRVPLFVKLPAGSTPASSSTDKPVSLVDLLPTLCDYAGLDCPQPVSGLSLRPLIEGRPLDRDRIFCQFDGMGALGYFQRAVIRDDKKLIVHRFKDETFFEFYDLVADPGEMDNLAFDREQGHLCREYLTDLVEWMQRTGDRLDFQPKIFDRFLADYNGLKLYTPF